MCSNVRSLSDFTSAFSPSFRSCLMRSARPCPVGPFTNSSNDGTGDTVFASGLVAPGVAAEEDKEFSSIAAIYAKRMQDLFPYLFWLH